jgi:hypothetical protein
MRDNGEWKKICEQAAQEQDPERLLELTKRIIELLDQGLKDARQRTGTGRRAPDAMEQAEIGD